jgi:hypothetical protein
MSDTINEWKAEYMALSRELVVARDAALAAFTQHLNASARVAELSDSVTQSWRKLEYALRAELLADASDGDAK